MRPTPLALLIPALCSVLAAALVAATPAAEWPEFRGATGQGHAAATHLPLEWSTEKNVTWKQSVPGAGWSSPVIGHGRIFLTSGIATPEGATALHALCFDAATGQPLWNREIFAASAVSDAPIHAKNSPASPTPVIAGDRLYVHFGHHGTAALDLDGKIIWRNNRLRYDPVHGNGGSPIVVDDLLVFNADGDADPCVVALDKTTGEVAWKVPRTVTARQKFSFCTPLLITVKGQPQIVTPGSGAVSALDPRDGRELWHVRYGNGYSVVPRPVFAHGLLFIATGFNRADLLAIRTDGELAGDLTDTHIAWRTTKGAPLTPSVVVVGDELYAVNDAGIASCWDARTGTLHWQQRLEGNYSASPLAAAGRIYFQNETGTGTVLQIGKAFTKLATNKLDERTLASYAVTENALIIRTAAHLYRIADSAR